MDALTFAVNLIMSSMFVVLANVVKCYLGIKGWKAYWIIAVMLYVISLGVVLFNKHLVLPSPEDPIAFIQALVEQTMPVFSTAFLITQSLYQSFKDRFDFFVCKKDDMPVHAL